MATKGSLAVHDLKQSSLARANEPADERLRERKVHMDVHTRVNLNSNFPTQVVSHAQVNRLD